ncbi:MAG: gliding motility-associated transporter permease protein [Planctomycetaceae bacterium]|nr:gliding motility-associated transporter permease protein [Planctomycetaceae bacterium]
MAQFAATTVAPSTPDYSATRRVRYRRSWGLPLLAKELTELAARPRTYQIRVIYAASVLLIGFVILAANVPGGRVFSLSALGVGAPVLATMTVLQQLGLYLVLPVLACSTLTRERERQTLDLLLITTLSPWTIVFEKFLGVLIAAVNLLMLSLPMIVVCHVLGGITVEQSLHALLFLLLIAVRVTAVGIFCSAVCRTTNQALVFTYVTLFNMLGVEVVIQFLLIPVVNWFLPSQFPHFDLPPFVMIERNEPGLAALWIGTTTALWSTPFAMRLGFNCFTSLVCSLAFLPLARWFLAPPVHGWLWWFLRLRLPWQQQPRSEPQPEQIRDEHDVPGNDPIAWREGPRGNRTTWWIHSICLMTLPVLMVLFALSTVFPRNELRMAIALVYLLIWVGVTVWLCGHAAMLFVPERVNQTLDLLCCTPMTSRDIMRQKMQSIWRRILLCQAALMACVLFRTWYFPSIGYLLLSAVTIGLYPPLIAWQPLANGLKTQNGAGTILRSLLQIGSWCFFPLLLLAFGINDQSHNGLSALVAVGSFSPLTLLFFTEAFPGGHPSFPVTNEAHFVPTVILLVVLTVFWHGLRFLYLRHWSFQTADVALRGAPVQPEFDPQTAFE